MIVRTAASLNISGSSLTNFSQELGLHPDLISCLNLYCEFMAYVHKNEVCNLIMNDEAAFLLSDFVRKDFHY